MNNNYFLTLISLSILLFSITAHAKDPIYTGFFSNAAVAGYDPVAYFDAGKPVKGTKAYQLKYMGADWYFSSENNLQLFKAQPEKYAPQYGGYCAWAAGHGITAKGDPHQWTIHDGKLYLNIDKDIKNQWLQNKDHWITEADKNWPAVLGK